MVRPSKTKSSSNMLDHYDFSKGARGKYAKRSAQGTNLVLLEPDVAKVHLRGSLKHLPLMDVLAKDRAIERAL
ncbi:MAG: hypothetical protein EBR40_09700 [Proteobacteria bacterium]|nr:hypothetical protein [Pseudomonadota bacterium]